MSPGNFHASQARLPHAVDDPRGAEGAYGGIYMKLSVDSLHQCDGFVLFCQTFSEYLSRGVSFS
jgi:hypothetical protein